MIIDPWVGYFGIGLCYAMAVVHVSWAWIQNHVHQHAHHGPVWMLYFAMLVGMAVLTCGWPYFLIRDAWTWCRTRVACYLFTRQMRKADRSVGELEEPPPPPT